MNRFLSIFLLALVLILTATASAQQWGRGQLVPERGATAGGIDALTPFNDGMVYRLYRSSSVLKDARLHVATFDAEFRDAYNRENCDIARNLFAGQPGVIVRYWCEQGLSTCIVDSALTPSDISEIVDSLATPTAVIAARGNRSNTIR